MHEMSLVSRFLDIVLDEVEGTDVTRVVSVHLTIGELMDVVDSMIPGLFHWLARGTVAQDAEIVIKHVPAYVQCHRCQEAWRINVRDEATWTCPRCGAHKNYRMISGREFRIDSIEVETGDTGREAQAADVPAPCEPTAEILAS